MITVFNNAKNTLKRLKSGIRESLLNRLLPLPLDQFGELPYQTLSIAKNAILQHSERMILKIARLRDSSVNRETFLVLEIRVIIKRRSTFLNSL